MSSIVRLSIVLISLCFCSNRRRSRFPRVRPVPCGCFSFFVLQVKASLPLFISGFKVSIWEPRARPHGARYALADGPRQTPQSGFGRISFCVRFDRLRGKAGQRLNFFETGTKKILFFDSFVNKRTFCDAIGRFIFLLLLF